jgi:hypothetical protein
MEIKLNISLNFPLDAHAEKDYERLVKYCGSVEDVERNFEIEFSCGDGKYFNDFWKWTEGGALVANWPATPEANEEVFNYDGKVCLLTPPRLNAIKMSMVPEQMKAGKNYRFTIKYSPKVEQEVYYINGKERSRKWVG